MIEATTGSYQQEAGKDAYLAGKALREPFDQVRRIASEANPQSQDPEPPVNEGSPTAADPAPVDAPDNESLPGEPSTTPADY